MLKWDDTNNINFDCTVIFGKGYDFFGLENLRQEAQGPNGNYLMWPNDKKYSLYRDSDGAMAFEVYRSEKECKEAAERWCGDQYTRDPFEWTPELFVSKFDKRRTWRFLWGIWSLSYYASPGLKEFIEHVADRAAMWR